MTYVTYAKGFSLVEFLIALGLGAIVITGVVGVYAGNKTTSNIQNAIANLQSNGRYVTYITNKYLRMAGYQGCVNPTNLSVTNIVNPTHSQYAMANFTNAIYGYDAQGGGLHSPGLPGYLATLNIKPDTDVVEVRFASDIGLRLQNDMGNPSDTLTLIDTDGDSDFREGIDNNEIVFITDCEIGDIAAAGGSQSSSNIAITVPQNTSDSLSKSYTTDARVYRFEYYAFYIKDTGRTNEQGNTIFGLFMLDINGNETEVAEGVEDFQLQYGVDTTNNGSADTYHTADAVELNNQWDNVKSIKINRLITSVTEADTQQRNYVFNGSTRTASDRQIRRDWSNYVSIRNRSFP